MHRKPHGGMHQGIRGFSSQWPHIISKAKASFQMKAKQGSPSQTNFVQNNTRNSISHQYRIGLPSVAQIPSEFICSWPLRAGCPAAASSTPLLPSSLRAYARTRAW